MDPVCLGSAPRSLAVFAPRKQKVYLPQVVGTSLSVVGSEDKAYQIYELMAAHPRQGRVDMVWDRVLANAAQETVISQARNRWVGHVDHRGRGHNWMVETLFEYALPEEYGSDMDDNNIGSTAHGGAGRVESVWNQWLTSEKGHAIHILGLIDFFANQNHVGVGYCYDERSEWKHYWAVFTCPPRAED